MKRVAHRVEPQEQRLDRLDLEPAVDAPVAQRGVAPRVERRLELVDARDVEVGELRAQAAGVDDAVAELPARIGTCGTSAARTSSGSGSAHGSPVSTPTWPRSWKPKRPGAPRDLRDLPRLEVAPLLAVELRRLGEEQRLAREVDAVAEHVGRCAHLRLRRR